MRRLLPDESRHITGELPVTDLPAEATHGAHEELLPIGEDRREAGCQVADDEVAIRGEVSRQMLEPVLKVHAAGGNPALTCDAPGHGGHQRYCRAAQRT